ncbi:hypothetical protein [uncultured Ruegeria sp.]|uniref:hypothetical protein n=1 Tax=uncultured Ruegeria sp. TaxID=259304 RepID=UPI00261D4C40|nr:hypothetical protein [uncultured Ruegeria sp.]
MTLIAIEASADCWNFPFPFNASKVQTAEIVVDKGHVAVGFPDIGRAFIVSVDLSEAIELHLPRGDVFAGGPGFGRSVALDGDIVAIGAVRIGSHGAGVEQPAGFFHTGAVYVFDVSSGALLWHAQSDKEKAFGHSVFINADGVSFGIFEAPELDGRMLRLHHVARGAIEMWSREGEPLGLIDGPSDMRGFGAELSGSASLFTIAASADTLNIWMLMPRAGTAIQHASILSTLNRMPAGNLTAEGSTVAVSAGGGFAAADGRTLLMVPGHSPYEIVGGGPLALSEDRLSVLVRSAPEDQPYNQLVVYDITTNGTLAEAAKINHVVGAALEGVTLFAVLAEPGAPVRLCKMTT